MIATIATPHRDPTDGQEGTDHFRERLLNAQTSTSLMRRLLHDDGRPVPGDLPGIEG